MCYMFMLPFEKKEECYEQRETVDRFVAFMDEVKVPHTLSAANIPAADIEKIAEEIVIHGCDADGNLPSIPKIGKDGILAVLNMAK